MAECRKCARFRERARKARIGSVDSKVGTQRQHKGISLRYCEKYQQLVFVWGMKGGVMFDEELNSDGFDSESSTPHHKTLVYY